MIIVSRLLFFVVFFLLFLVEKKMFFVTSVCLFHDVLVTWIGDRDEGLSLAGTGGISALQISHTAKFLVIEEIKNAPDSLEVVLSFHFAVCTVSCFCFNRVCAIICFNYCVGVKWKNCLMISSCYQPHWIGLAKLERGQRKHQNHIINVYNKGSADWIRRGYLLWEGDKREYLYCEVELPVTLLCGATCACMWLFVVLSHELCGILWSWPLLRWQFGISLVVLCIPMWWHVAFSSYKPFGKLFSFFSLIS